MPCCRRAQAQEGQKLLCCARSTSAKQAKLLPVSQSLRQTRRHFGRPACRLRFECVHCASFSHVTTSQHTTNAGQGRSFARQGSPVCALCPSFSPSLCDLPKFHGFLPRFALPILSRRNRSPSGRSIALPCGTHGMTVVGRQSICLTAKPQQRERQLDRHDDAKEDTSTKLHCRLRCCRGRGAPRIWVCAWPVQISE